jgi:hypothetical protein
LSRASLGDVIRGTIHDPATLPYEGADLSGVLLADLTQEGPFVTYGIRATAAAGGASLVDPRLEVVLPPGFAYVEDSATLDATDAAAALGAATVTMGGSGRQIVTWHPDLYVAAGTSVRLELQANPGAVLGTFLADAAMSGQSLSGPYEAASGPGAPVEVVERFDGNGPEADSEGWTEVPSDTLVFSHLSSPDDVDIWRIPVPAAPHTRMRIVLSHLPADYDLVLGGATANPLNSNPLNSNPLNSNPLNSNPLNSNPIVPEQGTPWHANQPGTSTPPETLQDLPLNSNPLSSNGIRAVSIERGTTHEVIVIETVDGEGGYFPLQVSGYNGAHADQPYVLRYHVLDPRRIDLGACQPKSFPTGKGAAGPLPAPADAHPETNTLFLVAEQRLADRFGAQARDELMQALAEVGGRADLSVRGLVVPVDGARWDGKPNTVAHAYAGWDAARCDPVAANTVAGSIRDLVLEYRRALPIEHVVVLGDDDQAPHLRVRDGSMLANEVEYVSSAVAALGSFTADGEPAHGTPLTAALQAGLFLTDDHLGTAQARPWLDHAVWIPDVGVGRLPGDVTTMIQALEHFASSDGLLQPTTAAVAGYDHLSDGAALVADNLDARLNVGTRRLIDDTWTRQALGSLLSFGAGERHVVASPNGHADHARLLPALGNLLGDESDLYDVDDLAQLPQGSLLFSMACHFGFDLPTGDPGEIRDWADAVTALQGLLVANTGFNYGDTVTVAAGELFAALFAEQLDGTVTVGQAIAMTKAEMFAREGLYGAEYLKAMQGMVTYGLPMYDIAADAPSDDPAITWPGTVHDPLTGLDVVDVTLDFPLVDAAANCPVGSSCLVAENSSLGTYHRVVGPLGYAPLAVSGRPIGPRAVIDLTELIDGPRRVHGAVLMGADSIDVPALDPAFARSTVDQAALEPELQSLGTVFPTLPLRIATVDTPVGERQLLTVLPWTFRSTGLVDGSVVGNLRLDTRLRLRLFLSPSPDNVPAEIGTVSARRHGQTVGFTVTTRPVSGQILTVVALYRDEFGRWHRASLASTDGGTRWAGVGPLPGLSDEPLDVVIQAVDANGDVAFWLNKGDQLPINEQPGELPFTISGEPGEDGWFRSAVTLELPPLDQGQYEVVFGSGDPVQIDGHTVTVDTDGIHRLDVFAPDGSAARDVVLSVDTTPPAITILSPQDGATFSADDVVTVAFRCADMTSGVSSCQGAQPDGTVLDLVPGSEQSFTVTARDRAGNVSTATATYEVLGRDLQFDGFYSPVTNGVFNVISQSSQFGSTIPFKWRLYRDGELLTDTSLVQRLRWQEVRCTDDVAGATPIGEATPAESVNDHGIKIVARRMQFESVVPAAFYPTCRRFDVVLADGQVHSAWFRFTPDE